MFNAQFYTHQYIHELQCQKASACRIHPCARYSLVPTLKVAYQLNYAQIHPRNLSITFVLYMQRFKRRDFLIAVPSGSMFRSNTIIVSLECKQNKLIKIIALFVTQKITIYLLAFKPN